MYELYIKNKEGVFLLADLGDDNPAMVYQTKDIGDLNVLRNDMSQRILLPITQTNSKIFGHANIHDVKSDAPYTSYECRMFNDGVSLVGGGGALPNTAPQIRLLRVSNTFECQIISGVAGVLNWFKAFSFNEGANNVMFTDLGSYNRIADSPSMNDPSKSFGFGAFSSVENLTDLLSSGFSYEVTPPYVKFKKMLDIISTNMGMRIVHNIPNIDNIATLATGIKTTRHSLSSFGGSVKQSTKAIGIGRLIEWATSTDGKYWTYSSDKLRCYYTAQYSGSISFGVYPAYSGYAKVIIKNLSTSSQVILHSSQKEIVYGTITFSKGEKIEVTAEATTTALRGLEVHIDTQETEDGLVPLNGSVSVLSNMGFDNLYEYIMAMAKALSLLVDYDGAKHILYLTTVDVLYQNKPKSKDWSRKLDISNISVEYTSLGYARNNFIRFEDDKNAGFKDAISFYVSNDNIEATKDLYKLKFEAGDNRPLTALWSTNGELADSSYLSAVVPIYRKEGNEYKYIGSGKPRLVYLDDSITMVHFFPLTKHMMGDHIKRVYMDKLVNNLLRKPRQVTAMFYLTSQDIEEYDRLVPIYVDYMGAYFYVNKINNFIAGKLTQCELIQL